MRENLFRGKKKNSGTWIFGSLIVLDSDYYYIVPEHKHASTMSPAQIIRCSMELIDPETVCQYTGLIDKNGRKIFEGDILKSDLGKIGKIAFNESHMAFTILENIENKYYYVEECDGNHMEIIGNIFDNPELLN